MIRTASRIADVEEYYFSKKLAEVRGLDSPTLRVINLGIGSPDMAPSQEAIETLCQTAAAADSHGYQNYRGIPELRQGIAAFCSKTYGVNISHENEILPLMGSKEGILHISMAFLDEGDEVLVPDPGYPTYSSAAHLAGGRIRYYQLDESKGWAVDVEALHKQDLSKVKIMWVNYPHMPTGRVASRAELQQLVDLAREKQFLIVNDNPYSLILNDTPLSVLSIPGAKEVALELNSLSKSHNMAGWRIGWVAGKKEFIDAVLKVKSNMDSGMFLGLQKAAVKAHQAGDDWFRRLNQTYRERRTAARNLLEVLGCRYSDNQSGLFVWAKIPDAVPEVEPWIDEILYATRVFITPGFIFGKAGERFVRISLCAPEEKIKQALHRIRNWKSGKTEKVAHATKPII